MRFTVLIFLLVISLRALTLAQTVLTGTVITSPPQSPSSITTGIVTYKAENYISLVGGFFAGSGSTFRAYVLSPSSYAEMKTTLDAGFVTTIDNVLYFKYVEKYSEGTLDFNIYNYKREVKLKGSTYASDKVKPSKAIKVGSNFYAVDLKDSSLLSTPEVESYYTLEIVNSKGDKSLLRFRYIAVN